MDLVPAAAGAIAVKPQGMTITAYMVALSLPLLAAILVALLRLRPTMRKLENESNASLRTDLLKRISDMEKEHAEERKMHVEEMASIRKEVVDERRRCDDELAKLRAQLDGLHRQIIQWQLSERRPFPLNTPASDKAAEALVHRLDDTP